MAQFQFQLATVKPHHSFSFMPIAPLSISHKPFNFLPKSSTIKCLSNSPKLNLPIKLRPLRHPSLTLRSRLVCNMSGSDMISQLELDKPEERRKPKKSVNGAAANFVSWLILPKNAVSVGASGAVFGLFAISVLVKMSWDWRKILEVLILGQFVVEKAAQASAGMSGTFIGGYSVQSINHIAHLSGALFGVFLNKALNLREKRDKTS
ncbi:hypothetical protein CUMW_110320 [Citrus unshiu]|nr:hypothetical protein CUMW_110320 [Citrus unshiu]